MKNKSGIWLNVVKSILFIVFGFLLFITIQKVFTPDHNKEAGNPGYTFPAFRKLPSDFIDVIFLGTSLTLDDISPMKIYETTGIKSYNLSSSGQPISLSYFILKTILQTQTPRVVVLDVSSLYRIDAIVAWRYVVDNLTLDKNLLDMSREYNNIFSEKGENALNVIFPLLKYHMRWNELTRNDFIRFQPDSYYSMGYYLESPVTPGSATIEDIDSIAKVVYENRNISQVPQIQEEHLSYLERIYEICKKNNIELILIKVPSLVYPQDSYGRISWNQFTYNQMCTIAEEMGLTYIDMNYDVDTGVDFKIDSVDGGVHLNIRGAEKVSAFLGAYLTEHYALDQQQNEVWEKEAVLYDSMRDIAYLHSELEFRAYLSMLAENMEGKTIVIAAKEEYVSGLDEDDFALFQNLGLSAIRDGKFTDSYLAVIHDGVVEYEKVSEQRINYQNDFEDMSVNAVSSGWYSTSLASVKINGKEYAMNSNGLNIVVWDNESGMPLDSAAVNTRYPGSKVAHSGAIYSYLRNYEGYQMQHFDLVSVSK